jgi:uncharacterized Zn-finger protein
MMTVARGCGRSFARYDRAAFKLSGKNRMSTKAPETIVVTRTRVACDGGEGALGHPRVYLEMGEETFVVCGYCDRRFVLSPEAIEARARGEAEAH